MPELHFSLSFHVLLILLAAAMAILGAMAAYRVTVPPIPRRLAATLIALRAAALFLLFLLIGEPLISLLYRSQEPPGIVFLLDNSKSMTIKDKKGDRKTRFFQTLQSNEIRRISAIGAPHTIVFDSRPRLLESFEIDSLTFTGDATDLAAALRAVQTLAAANNIRGIVLVSDGNANLGSSPLGEAEELSLPVFTIGLGDTTEQRDLMIRKVITNNITYVGNRVPVHVTLKSSGYGGRRVEVIVRDAEKIHDRQFLEIKEGTREYVVTLFVVPPREGMQKFTVAVSVLPEELTNRNNVSSFFMKVLESKMKVLLIAGSPSADVSVIRKSLESDKNVELSTRIERQGGQFYEGPMSLSLMQDSDCIVLVGFPTSATPLDVVGRVETAGNQGKGILIVLSRTIDGARLQTLQGILPITIQSFSDDEYQAFVHIPESQRNNVLIRLSDDARLWDSWEKLPPLFKLRTAVKAKPESEIVAQTRIQSTVTNEPFLVSRNVNRRKSLAVLGYGLWRWKIGAEDQEELFQKFLGNVVRWLTTREDDRRVRVAPAKEVFRAEDPLEFTAQVYDDSFRGIDDAEVSVSISRGTETYPLTLASLGNGQYEGSLEALPEGDYTYQASVTSGGTKIAEDRGSFSFGGLNLEFQDTRLNKSLLEQLAARSGGAYYDPENLQDLPRAIQSIPSFQPREIVRISELEIWNLPWSLSMLVGLFAFEWFLRKRNGML